jgi:hypothetical protein
LQWSGVVPPQPLAQPAKRQSKPSKQIFDEQEFAPASGDEAPPTQAPRLHVSPSVVQSWQDEPSDPQAALCVPSGLQVPVESQHPLQDDAQPASGAAGLSSCASAVVAVAPPSLSAASEPGALPASELASSPLGEPVIVASLSADACPESCSWSPPPLDDVPPKLVLGCPVGVLDPDDGVSTPPFEAQPAAIATTSNVPCEKRLIRGSLLG